MPVKERIKEYIKYKKISNTEFCRTINDSLAFISSMRKSIQPDKIERIALNFPDLNTGWLLTGEGKMLKSDINADQKEENYKERYIKLLEESNDSQKKTIDHLEKCIDILTKSEGDKKAVDSS